MGTENPYTTGSQVPITGNVVEGNNDGFRLFVHIDQFRQVDSSGQVQ